MREPASLKKRKQNARVPDTVHRRRVVAEDPTPPFETMKHPRTVFDTSRVRHRLPVEIERSARKGEDGPRSLQIAP